MRLRKLRIENLGPIPLFEEELAPVTLVRGPNESGKSFLLDSIEVLRFGTCRGLKVGDSAYLARGGTKGWKVSALLQSGSDEPELIERTRTQKPNEDALVESLGDPRAFRALLHVQSFLDLSPSERRELVADLTARDTSSLVKRLNQLGADDAVVSASKVGNLKAAHRLSVEMRRKVSRSIKDAEAKAVLPECPVVTTKKGPRPVSDLPAELIEKGVANASKRYADIVRKSGASAGAARTVERADEAQKKLDGLPDPQWSKEDEKKLFVSKKDASENRLEAARVATERFHAISEAADLEELLKEGEDCPTCGQSLAKVKDAVKGTIGELHGKSQKALTRAKELAGEHELLAKLIADLLSRQSLASDVETQRRTLTQLVEAGAKVEVGGVVSDEDVADARAELERLQHVKQTRAVWDARVADSDAAKAALEGLAARLAPMEKIEALTDPSKMDDGDDAMLTLKAALAEYAPPLLGGPVVDVDDLWNVYIAGRDPALASDSVRIRAGVVFALALSQMSGIGMVFIDRLESLDESARPRLVTLLGKLHGDGKLDTAILAIVGIENKRLPPIPWLKGIYLKGGEVIAPTVNKEEEV